ncbi:MAG: alpha/beta hydrolase fold domain-containing protein, partial [Gammaproteobacteria bacterium]
MNTKDSTPRLHLDERILDDARRFNRKLALAPRFKVTNQWTPRLGQALLRLFQLGADRKLRRAGLSVQRLVASSGGVHVPVRVLRPAGAPQGVVLDIHGGGWVIGNPEMNDRLNADIIRACGVTVVSVDYRLAPHATVGEMIEQCTAAARWLLQGALPDCAHLPVIVIGESAGAHLAAATLQRLRAWPALLEPIAGAVLYYGVYDLAGTDSVRAAGPDTLVLDGPTMLPALRMLTPGLDNAARRDPMLSPLYGDLAGMPPALRARLDAELTADGWPHAATIGETRRRARRADAPNPSRALDELDPVAVRIAHEADARPARAHLV